MKELESQFQFSSLWCRVLRLNKLCYIWCKTTKEKYFSFFLCFTEFLSFL